MANNSQNVVSQLIENAVQALELDGNPQKALEILQRAYQLSEARSEKVGIQAEMGLCCRHMGDNKKAKQFFECALFEYSQMGDFVSVARMRRQISAIYLFEGQAEKALELAILARKTIVDHGLFVNDLCHMTHGVVAILLAKRKTAPEAEERLTAEIIHWVEIERDEVRTMMTKEKSFAKYVWQTGYLNDKAQSNPPYSFPAYIPMLAIVLFRHLGMRKKQILRK